VIVPKHQIEVEEVVEGTEDEVVEAIVAVAAMIREIMEIDLMGAVSLIGGITTVEVMDLIVDRHIAMAILFTAVTQEVVTTVVKIMDNPHFHIHLLTCRK